MLPKSFTKYSTTTLFQWYSVELITSQFYLRIHILMHQNSSPKNWLNSYIIYQIMIKNIKVISIGKDFIMLNKVLNLVFSVIFAKWLTKNLNWNSVIQSVILWIGGSNKANAKVGNYNHDLQLINYELINQFNNLTQL